MLERRLTGPKPRLALPAGAVDTQMHVYQPGFAAQPGGPSLPYGLPGVAEYRRVMDWLGLDRVVVTQGNAHQHDNGNLLAALALFDAITPGRARGVAVITGDTTDAEMARLHAAGVRGARIMDLPGGAVGLSALESVDARAAAMGWMLAVQFNGSDIAEHFPRLAALRSRWVLDHHGKFFRGARPDSPEIGLLKRLIDGGTCWYKVAGCYESSLTGAPDYADVAQVARHIAAVAPQRIVWGTNFPHNLAQTTAEYPDDAALLETTLGWLPSDTARHRALVENPVELYQF